MKNIAHAPGMTSSLPLGWLPMAGLLLLCSPYLQGGLTKAFHFQGAIAEMQHFGLAPTVPLALAAIVLELGAPVLILSGFLRWAGAAALGLFTLTATFLANRFWQAPPAEQFMMTNTFFEHLALVGAFVLVAWADFRNRART